MTLAGLGKLVGDGADGLASSQITAWARQNRAAVAASAYGGTSTAPASDYCACTRAQAAGTA